MFLHVAVNRAFEKDLWLFYIRRLIVDGDKKPFRKKTMQTRPQSHDMTCNKHRVDNFVKIKIYEELNLGNLSCKYNSRSRALRSANRFKMLGANCLTQTKTLSFGKSLIDHDLNFQPH